jgi:MFS transporter, OPA family, glycerol-3-phosphate transporter
MFSFFKPPISSQNIPSGEVDTTYKALRFKVFMGIFLGYAGYYLVRKNFSMAMPDLLEQGYSKSDLGFALSGVSIAYGISKFVMGSLSDKSNARVFLSLGLLLSGVTMLFMGTSAWATSSIHVMFVLLLLNGWFQGMGWPPSGRVMVHWFSHKERGVKMSLWNIAHNVGGGLVGPVSYWAVLLFGAWQSKFYFPGLLAIALAALAYWLVRDTPAACGLPTVEDYKQDYSNPHQDKDDSPLSTKEIFRQFIWGNRLLWYIAFANAFIYLVRYGVLDWSPTYLEEAKGYSLEESGWSYFAYEYAGIPGTLLCGWLSDKVFKGVRSPAIVIYMLFVLAGVLVYWHNPPGRVWVDELALATIGFFIYGPVMLIGLFAIDIVPKNAAGTAAGLTGLFGYLGGAVFANMAMGWVLDRWHWDGGFVVLVLACLFSMLIAIPTWRYELRANTLSRPQS